ncbi:hypothetical protein ACFJGX_00550 [Hydrogenophaga sp. UC242_50]|uniref:hypothetical protein n=1 Tax=Hydrogenophaga sp. UC242_50 TaxID=3350169 RepID=UPI0036D2D479
MSDTDTHFLHQAIELARDNMAQGGRPFGAVVVRGGEVLAHRRQRDPARPTTRRPTRRCRPCAPPAAGSDRPT